MPRPKTNRRNLLHQLSRALGRELSARTIMLHQAIAERLGLNATDHKCLDMARRGEAMTAGELAELTGLTTGAITGVIDRLEHAGFVRRVRDANDRRRVLIQPIPERARDIAPLFESLDAAWSALCARYTDRELNLINTFMNDSIVMLRGEAQKVREAVVRRKPVRAKRATAARGSRSRARRVFESAATSARRLRTQT
jgi:DNA-binding MarR family transcriptional regulator